MTPPEPPEATKDDDVARGSQTGRRPPLARSPSEREVLAQAIADRLNGPITALGVIFLLVVLAQTLTPAESPLSTVLETAGWLLWAVFVVEFVARMVIAPSTGKFLRRHWWQVIFLAVPFLRFLRIVHAVRAARAGRIVSSAVRSSRSAGRALTSRLGWLSAATVVIILAGSQLVFEFSQFATYADALHATALTVVASEPLPPDDAFSKIAEILLALYSVVVFAALAGTLGAFFVERQTLEHRSTASRR